MGKLLKALSPQSSYAAKGGKDGGGTLWADLMDELEQCIIERDLDEYVVRLETITLSIPVGWREPLQEAVEKRRDELRAEDIDQIVRDRFDFT